MRTFAGHQGHSEWVKKTRAGIISDCSPSYHTLHLLFFYFSLRDERPFILRGKVLATLQEWQMHLFLPWPKNKGWEKSEVEKILSSGRRSYLLTFCASSTCDCKPFILSFCAHGHVGMCGACLYVFASLVWLLGWALAKADVCFRWVNNFHPNLSQITIFTQTFLKSHSSSTTSKLSLLVSFGA